MFNKKEPVKTVLYPERLESLLKLRETFVDEYRNNVIWGEEEKIKRFEREIIRLDKLIKLLINKL